ncbi:flavonol 3-O-glucosyltransferase F3GT2-like, partial [Mercurialis annua]|uniref:flavonol 3-O-glucosyltransferase F3GT2-like n=1 Tax=Mercurialis annua TaxID=3986 RepID=UPI00215E641D
FDPMASQSSATILSPMKRHVVVMAFPFGSHPLSLFNLLKKLAISSPGTQFSFLNTKISNDSLFLASQVNNLPRNVKPYNVTDGSVLDNHVCSEHPEDMVELFMKATPDNFRVGLEKAVAETGRVSCLITDAFLLFGGEIAENLNIPWIPVWLPVPISLSVHIYTDIIRHYYYNDDILKTIPGLGQIQMTDLPHEVLSNEKEETLLLSCMLRQVGSVLPQCTALVMNFYEELYPKDLLNDLKSKFSCLLNVGFVNLELPPPLSDTDQTGCLLWLDSLEAKSSSVAYISFGTMVSIPSNEIKELAEALEESKIHFLWSIRDNLRDQLPDGFLERTKLKGKLVSWAPQTQVLAHDSIGVFVTHGGSNSMLESMTNAVPMICRSVFADSMINTRIVEEIWGIGVRVDDGVFTKKGLIKNLEIILNGEEQGRRIRENACAMQQLVFNAAEADGRANKDFKTLVDKISLN